MSINGNPVGSYSHLGKTLTLVDDNGIEVTGVIVDNETVFTATDNDVREGSIYASDGGVSTGSKVIPSYHTTEGFKAIMAGEEMSISLPSLNRYDYTKLQVIICAYNASSTDSVADSVAAEKVSIDSKVYAVGSTDCLSNVTKDEVNKSIVLGITNESDSPVILRYFTYKEID